MMYMYTDWICALSSLGMDKFEYYKSIWLSLLSSSLLLLLLLLMLLLSSSLSLLLHLLSLSSSLLFIKYPSSSHKRYACIALSIPGPEGRRRHNGEFYQRSWILEPSVPAFTEWFLSNCIGRETTCWCFRERHSHWWHYHNFMFDFQWVNIPYRKGLQMYMAPLQQVGIWCSFFYS